MTDQAVQWIQQQIHSYCVTNTQGNAIWLLDENHSGLLEANQHPQLRTITNRQDLHQEAIKQGYQSQFSDFDFSDIADNSLDRIFYRVSKEKALVNHIINQAWRCLKMNGELIIAGHKQEGTKTWIEKISSLFGDKQSAEKNGQVYTGSIRKHKQYDTDSRLDDQNYSQLRSLIPIGQFTAFSKPGLFGWNKIDQGSELLTQHLDLLELQHTTPTNCLDLGCGYGFLTLAAAQNTDCRSIKEWTLTDNNAAAILAAQQNTQMAGLTARVIADDAGSSINNRFDLILCNPPFHQGFQADADLTEKFVRQTHRLLAKSGGAFFVVNQFVPLETKASPLFKSLKVLHQEAGFKLILLQNPK